MKLETMKHLPHHFGKVAENLAVRHLQEKGFEMIERNYRYKRAEVDIIAKQKNLLLFIEVKGRSSERFGHPEEFVTTMQQRLLLEAAAHYVIEHNWTQPIRFDIIAILMKKGQLQVTHLEDAFY